MKFHDYVVLSALIRGSAYLILTVYAARRGRWYGVPMMLTLLFDVYSGTTPTEADNFLADLLFTPMFILTILRAEAVRAETLAEFRGRNSVKQSPPSSSPEAE